jgi:hypothetical protein
MYSLVSSAVLAIDLARHPSGTAVADAVDRVLALTAAERDRMHTPADDATRQRVLEHCRDEPRMSTLMGGVAATVAEGLPSNEHSRVLVQALNETLVGGLDDLHRMIAVELDAPAAAVQVAQDAVTVAWAGRLASLSDLAALRAPWANALDPVAPALERSTYALQALLEEIGRRSPRQWQRTLDAHGAHRGSFAWSSAMHEACRVAFDHGRLTDVARSQLAAARQLRLSGASTGPDAHALGMAVTAAVQATALADLLLPSVTHALLGAWEAGQ